MRVTQIICLIFVVIGCNNSNNDKIIPQKEFESVSQHNDSLTDEILNSTFTKYDGDTHNGVRTLINLKQIRKIYRSKLLENNKNDINTDDILKRYLKTTAIIYDNYYNLESILEKNLDTFNINQVISSNKKLEEASVSSVVSEYFENIKNVRNTKHALLFIEEFHNELINSIIKNNSLTEFSIDNIDHLEASVSVRCQPYTKDSVKIFLMINDSVPLNRTIFIWRTDPASETRNKFIGPHLIVSKEHDTIFGESPLYTNDTVYWKPWKVSTFVSL